MKLRISKNKESKNPEPNGTFFAFKNGRLARTIPIYKDRVKIESIDTTGYSKGKKDFTLETRGAFNKPENKKVLREEVPNVIDKLKKGATRVEDYTKKSKS